jgi:SAM-dependent methyltransferase
MPLDDYRAANLANWNDRVPIHVRPDGYDVDADFVEAELYDAPSAVPGSFDIVYTGVGAINWLPDIAGWARVAAHFVAPGGTFYIRDGHPMLYTMDWERQDDELVVAHPYFEHEEPITDDFDETYAGSGKVANARQYEWNHGLSEIIQGLIDAGLRIERFDEHRFLDWQGLDHMEMRDGVWVLPDGQHELVPLMFSILATKT